MRHSVGYGFPTECSPQYLLWTIHVQWSSRGQRDADPGSGTLLHDRFTSSKRPFVVEQTRHGCVQMDGRVDCEKVCLIRGMFDCVGYWLVFEMFIQCVTPLYL